jgi:hypothetical protein
MTDRKRQRQLESEFQKQLQYKPIQPRVPFCSELSDTSILMLASTAHVVSTTGTSSKTSTTESSLAETSTETSETRTSATETSETITSGTETSGTITSERETSGTITSERETSVTENSDTIITEHFCYYKNDNKYDISLTKPTVRQFFKTSCAFYQDISKKLLLEYTQYLVSISQLEDRAKFTNMTTSIRSMEFCNTLSQRVIDKFEHLSTPKIKYTLDRIHAEFLKSNHLYQISK